MNFNRNKLIGNEEEEFGNFVIKRKKAKENRVPSLRLQD